jgi:hypothetical protein
MPIHPPFVVEDEFPIGLKDLGGFLRPAVGFGIPPGCSFGRCLWWWGRDQDNLGFFREGEGEEELPEPHSGSARFCMIEAIGTGLVLDHLDAPSTGFEGLEQRRHDPQGSIQ